MVADNRPADLAVDVYDGTDDHQKSDAPKEHDIVDANNNAERLDILNDLANYDTEHLDGYSAEDEAEEMAELCQHNEPFDDCEICELEALEELCEHDNYRVDCEECEDERRASLECEHGFLREECGECDLECEHGNPYDDCEECEMKLIEKDDLDACPHGFLLEDCDGCIEQLSFCEHEEVRTACEICLEEDVEEENEAEEAFWQSDDDFSDPDVPTSTAKMWERDRKREIRRRNRMAHIAQLFGEAKESCDVDVKSRKRSRSDSDDRDEVHRKVTRQQGWSSKASDDSSE